MVDLADQVVDEAEDDLGAENFKDTTPQILRLDYFLEELNRNPSTK